MTNHDIEQDLPAHSPDPKVQIKSTGPTAVTFTYSLTSGWSPTGIQDVQAGGTMTLEDHTHTYSHAALGDRSGGIQVARQSLTDHETTFTLATDLSEGTLLHALLYDLSPGFTLAGKVGSGSSGEGTNFSWQWDSGQVGLCTVSFTSGLFAATPTVVITPGTSSKNSYTSPNGTADVYTVASSIKSVSATSFKVSIQNLAPALETFPFDFIAVGPLG